jgi:hypothetical protein
MRRIAVVVLAFAAGCPSSSDPPACITVDTMCQPLYVPTFDNVYTNTLKDGCGSERVSCHSREGLKGGMSFEDPQHAYDALLAGRVEPGNPACSDMIVRTGSPGADYQMPKGPTSAALSVAEQCALVLWVQNGAPGPAVAP